MDSVFAQDYPGKVELIVVDQSEKHNERVKNYFRAHGDRFKHIAQSEPNLPRARNTGFSAAKGQLIFFLDDDMILPPNAISQLARHFYHFQLRVVSGLIISEGNPEQSLQRYARDYGIDVARDTHPKEVRRFVETARFLPAEAVRAVGGCDDLLGVLTPAAYGEDDDFLHRLRVANIPLLIDPTVRILHRDHLSGGCDSRTTDFETTRKYHMKSIAYMSAKYRGRVGLLGWVRLARGYFLNGDALAKGLRYMRICFEDARDAVREVESFIAEHKKSALAPATKQ
jgi:glycosyltransferase involved in cell wall biosynthesis